MEDKTKTPDNRFKALRIALKLSKEELSQIMRKSVPCISDYESGKTPVRLSTDDCNRLLEFKINPTYIIGLSNNFVNGKMSLEKVTEYIKKKLLNV